MQASVGAGRWRRVRRLHRPLSFAPASPARPPPTPGREHRREAGPERDEEQGEPQHLAYAVAGAVIGQHLTRSEAPAPPVDLPPGELPLLAEALGEGPATLDARLEFSLDALIAGARVLLDGAGE